jgi:hypothetical protein
MGRGIVVGLLASVVVLVGFVAVLVLKAEPGHGPGKPPPETAVAVSNKLATVAPPAVNSASDITAGGPAPARIDPEQHTTFDDVHYIPPVGLRQTITVNSDEKSIWLGRLEKLISAKVGRVVSVSRAWAYKEKDGDVTVCGGYMGASEPILFVYNTGGVKGTTPELYLNVDQNTYSSFGCDQSSAASLIGE